MPGLTLDSFGAWDGALLQSLPQSTIPATATGIARSDQYVQDYTPTELLNADGTPASGNITSAAPQSGHGSLLDTILGGVQKVLGATHLSIDASGSGISVVQGAQAPRTIVNTASPTRQLLENPFVWAGVLLGAWLIWENR